MNKRDRVVEMFIRLVNRYHQLKEREGIDTPASEWARAEISGARAILEATVADRERGSLYAQVQIRTAKELPSRERLNSYSRCFLFEDDEPRMSRVRERLLHSKNH
jgi:hypothetical protein